MIFGPQEEKDFIDKDKHDSSALKWRVSKEFSDRLARDDKAANSECHDSKLVIQKKNKLKIFSYAARL